jgi:putative ABC transport system permease protein
LVEMLLPTFNHLSNKSLSLSYLFDIKLVLGYIALLLITSLLAGFYPALVLSSFNPVKTLYSRFSYGGKNYLQRGLVVLQFSLATILIIATITIYRQFNYLTTKPLGYDDTNLVTVEKWGISRDEYKHFSEQLSANPNIIGIAPKNGGSWGTTAKVNGETQLNFAYETVDEAYLPLMKIPLVTGRNFSKEFLTDSSTSVLVNETFVQKAGWKNPIGQVVNFWYNEKQYNVIGVVKDHHYDGINRPIEPQLFTMKPDNQFGKVFIKIKPGTEEAVLPFIQSTFKKLFPLFPYSYRFQTDENLKQYEAEAKWKQMMMFAAIITIFISCIGLFGLSVLNAEKRTKEVGIRKVLGASVSGIAGQLSKDFLRLVMLALLIAMPSAWLLARKWLEDYPYRIDIGWTLFATASIIVLGIAAATVSIQAIKAAGANPTKSLRSE